MFTVSLLTSPTRPALDPALPEALRNAWGGRDVVWLAPDEAAEFDVAVRPGNFWTAWDELQGFGVDLCLQPATGREKRLLIADMDSTMIGQECIDELAEVAGAGDDVRAVTARAMNGEIDFVEAVKSRLALLAGLPETAIATVLAHHITLAQGGPVALATMKARGTYTALVSGGFTAFTGPVARVLGFDEHRSNVLEIENGHLTGRVAGPILGNAAKVEALDELAARLGLSDDQVMAVGDGANDLGMLGRAGAGVALHAKPAVAGQCDLRINHGDLTALLFLQGIAKSEFIDPGTLAPLTG